MKSYYIGHACDAGVRFKSSSGGIGTAITKYLLSLPSYSTAITFEFVKGECRYVPKLIHDPEDINVCGSIYHDIDISAFIKNNVDDINGGLVVSCPPCQVSGIRRFLDAHNIPSFIISFSCSGQTKLEGTWKYLEFVGVDKSKVDNLQYRGNGWPSGIQISMDDGQRYFYENFTEPWTTIHESLLYSPRRCLHCIKDAGHDADVSLADPWLDEYKKTEKIGETLFCVNTDLGVGIIEKMTDQELIICRQSSYNAYAIAQKPNVQKYRRNYFNKRYLKFVVKLLDNKAYVGWATSSLACMKKHVSFLHKLAFVLRKRNLNGKMSKFISKVLSKVRFCFIKNKLGSCKNNLWIQKHVIFNHPECLHLGNNVGIADNVFFGPIVEYAGIPYNPEIRIGDGTWIGKNCSIASIDRVQIGKNVLFAGQVHITDHSHGYEDINIPVAQQPLLSKGPVIIDDYCWLGFACEILSGVHIGQHCVIGARAVVTKDVPDYCVVAGNPARVIKRYDPETGMWVKSK